MRTLWLLLLVTLLTSVSGCALGGINLNGTTWKQSTKDRWSYSLSFQSFDIDHDGKSNGEYAVRYQPNFTREELVSELANIKPDTGYLSDFEARKNLSPSQQIRIGVLQGALDELNAIEVSEFTAQRDRDQAGVYYLNQSSAFLGGEATHKLKMTGDTITFLKEGTIFKRQR